jgi:hypothetical protein
VGEGGKQSLDTVNTCADRDSPDSIRALMLPHRILGEFFGFNATSPDIKGDLYALLLLERADQVEGAVAGKLDARYLTEFGAVGT